jgi:hypothetical protein
MNWMRPATNSRPYHPEARAGCAGLCHLLPSPAKCAAILRSAMPSGVEAGVVAVVMPTATPAENDLASEPQVRRDV